MDVVIHASDREPFGIVVIEAMALGKPVVAADSGGPREILSHEVEGLPAALLSRCSVHVRIPMHGTKRSLNVATAGGVVRRAPPR